MFNKCAVGNATSKNGWLTNTVEFIPGGGVFTAPIHHAAGNHKEAGIAWAGVAADVTTLGTGGTAVKATMKAGKIAAASVHVQKTANVCVRTQKTVSRAARTENMLKASKWEKDAMKKATKKTVTAAITLPAVPAGKAAAKSGSTWQ